MKVHTGAVNRIEHRIAPPMKAAITIPVEMNGRQFAIYVCIGGFDFDNNNETDLLALAKWVGNQLTLNERREQRHERSRSRKDA